MSFFVGAGLWMVVGLVLGFWAADAEREWQKRLTEHGLMPDGPDDPMSAAMTPASFFRRRWAYLAAAYPSAVRTDNPETETWRLRRMRRRRLFVGWMFGGLILAILTMLAVEGGQDNAWWFVALLPIAALLFFVVRAGYRYGQGHARDHQAAP